MQPLARTVALLVLTLFAVPACGGSQPAASAPAEPATPPAEASAKPDVTPAARPGLTAEACEKGGGSVVGDIGDGAIHRHDYRCPSGAAPTGSIQEKEGGPMGVEGSVCCPK